MSTRLGIYSDDAFAHHLQVGNGFLQGLLNDSGYMVPHHEYTMQLPASLSMDMKYRIYEMYTCFVRTALVLNTSFIITVLDDELFFVLRVMEYFDNEEEARCRHKQLSNDEFDFYNLDEFKVFELQDTYE